MGRWDGYVRPQCGAPGCDRIARVRGLCGTHHMRVQRTGSYEPILKRAANGVAAAFIQSAIDSQTDECIIWPFSKTSHDRAHGGGDGRDYAQANIGGRTRRVHVYVCETVNGLPPPGHEAAHNCGNQPCINPRHLRWATRAENQADRVQHGTSNRGERQWNAKLTADDVLSIRAFVRRNPTANQRGLAERYGVGVKTINDAVLGKTWGWLTPP